MFGSCFQSYNIYMKQNGKLTKIDSALENYYTFTNLKPDTKYDVGISAMANEEGPIATYSFSTSVGGEFRVPNLI